MMRRAWRTPAAKEMIQHLYRKQRILHATQAIHSTHTTRKKRKKLIPTKCKNKTQTIQTRDRLWCGKKRQGTETGHLTSDKPMAQEAKQVTSWNIFRILLYEVWKRRTDEVFKPRDMWSLNCMLSREVVESFSACIKVRMKKKTRRRFMILRHSEKKKNLEWTWENRSVEKIYTVICGTQLVWRREDEKEWTYEVIQRGWKNEAARRHSDLWKEWKLGWCDPKKKRKKEKKLLQKILQSWLGEPVCPGPKRKGVTRTRTIKMKYPLSHIHPKKKAESNQPKEGKTFIYIPSRWRRRRRRREGLVVCRDLAGFCFLGIRNENRVGSRYGTPVLWCENDPSLDDVAPKLDGDDELDQQPNIQKRMM